ncbi:two pore calcium channel protein 2-like isoform X4 [Arapaima gigas]
MKEVQHRHHEDDLCIQQAVVFIEDAIQYRSINHRVDSRSLRLYRWYYSIFWQWTLVAVIGVILGLAFVEKPSSLSLSSDPHRRLRPWEPPCGATEGVEMVGLLLFALDLAVKGYLIGWEEFRKNKWLVAYVVVVSGSVIDLLLSVSMMCDESLRVRRVFRPFFLLQNSSLMKKTLKSIRRTLPEIASVILLLALHVCFFTMFGMLLFAKREKPEENGEWETYFRNLTVSLSSLLVLLTTANNPDVMIPAYTLNRLYSIFFVLFSVVGTYLMMNLITAIIYNQFRGYLLKSIQSSIMRRRLGIRAAFAVLCCRDRIQVQDQDQVRVQDQEKDQVQDQVQVKQHHVYEACKVTEGYVEGQAFLKLFEELEKDRIKEHPPMPEYSSRFMQTLQFLMSHYCFTMVGNVMAVANIICICCRKHTDHLLSERGSSSCLSPKAINVFFVTFYVVEMLLKMLALGFRRYLSYRSDVFDGFLTLSLLVGARSFLLVLQRRIRFCSIYTFCQKDFFNLREMMRLANMLIVFRFLRIIPNIKLMALVASTLMDLVKNLRAFAGILLVVYYVFAILGIWLFHGVIKVPANMRWVSTSSSLRFTENSRWDCGSYENLGYWPNNFDDFAASLVLLYNVMVVNNWQVFLEAYAKYTTEWSKVYFVSWWLISSVMWVNMFVALILENFTYKWDRSQGCSVTDVERIRYESSVQLVFGRDMEEPTEEELLDRLHQHPHLHLPQ